MSPAQWIHVRLLFTCRKKKKKEKKKKTWNWKRAAGFIAIQTVTLFHTLPFCFHRFAQSMQINYNSKKEKKWKKKKTIYILTLLVFAARNKWMPLISTIFHRRKWPKPWICWEIWLWKNLYICWCCGPFGCSDILLLL